MGKQNNNHSREAERFKLQAQLEDVQRRLCDATEEISKCETKIRENRIQLDEGFDHKHVKWLVPSALLLAGAALLFALEYKALGYFCVVIGIISACRWLSELMHCWRKYSRCAKRIQYFTDERDKQAEKASELRLKTMELRRQAEKLDAWEE